MIYQVYFESISIQTVPTEWYAGYPIQYKYGQKVLYPEPIEEYKSLKQAVERAEYLSCVTDLGDYKYTNVKVSEVNSKGKTILTIPFENHKHFRDINEIIPK